MTLFIFVMGVATVVLSIWAAGIFLKHGTRTEESGRLCVALTLQLIGEAVIGMGTVSFAMAAHFGWLPNWPIELQSLIRFIMFFATSTTTLHLVYTVNTLRSERVPKNIVRSCPQCGYSDP